MTDEAPIQTETTPTLKLAYMMQQGEGNAYIAWRMQLDGDKIVTKEMIGQPDLKPVVFGRIMKLLFVMR